MQLKTDSAQPAKRPVVATLVASLLLGTLLTGCGSGSNIIDKVTGKNDEVLPGKRESALGNGNNVKLASEPVVIPVAATNTSWAQPGGVASNALANLSLGRELKRAFVVDAGKGSTKTSRLTAMPIVVAGRIFVMDSRNRVRSFSASNGAPGWTVALAPKGRGSSGVFGGGIASDGRNIYAATAFGEVVALSLGSGAEIWRVKVDAPIKTAPTVAAGKIFFVTIRDKTYALSTDNGQVVWTAQSRGAPASTISNTSPAVSGGVVVSPHTDGEIEGLASAGGQRLWRDNLAGNGAGGSVANINAIAGRPVIHRGQVFAISNSGRMGSYALKSGQQLWSKNISGDQTPWVSGDYVFVISRYKRLAAISRKTGNIKWVSDLPGTGRWTGPVLGGGRLLVASNKGVLASISPQTGQLMNKQAVGSAFYIAPIIANNTIYLLDDKARLYALR